MLRRRRAPILRALTSTDQRYDDPSEDLLFDLLAELKPDDHIIVERLADTSRQTFAQVLRTDVGYLIEKRDGSEATHAHAESPDMRLVHHDLTTWAYGVERAHALDWALGLG